MPCSIDLVNMWLTVVYWKSEHERWLSYTGNLNIKCDCLIQEIWTWDLTVHIQEIWTWDVTVVYRKSEHEMWLPYTENLNIKCDCRIQKIWTLNYCHRQKSDTLLPCCMFLFCLSCSAIWGEKLSSASLKNLFCSWLTLQPKISKTNHNRIPSVSIIPFWKNFSYTSAPKLLRTEKFHESLISMIK